MVIILSSWVLNKLLSDQVRANSWHQEQICSNLVYKHKDKIIKWIQSLKRNHLYVSAFCVKPGINPQKFASLLWDPKSIHFSFWGWSHMHWQSHWLGYMYSSKIVRQVLSRYGWYESLWWKFPLPRGLVFMDSSWESSVIGRGHLLIHRINGVTSWKKCIT